MLAVDEMETRPLLGTVEEKVFIVDVRENTARDSWKSPEQREKGVDLTWPANELFGYRVRKGDERVKEIVPSFK